MDNESDQVEEIEQSTESGLDRISGGTGATVGAAPGTIMGYAFGGPVGSLAGGALGGAVGESLSGNPEEASDINVTPQTSGYLGGYEENASRSESDQVTLDFPGLYENKDITGSDPVTGAPSDQNDTTTRIRD